MLPLAVPGPVYAIHMASGSYTGDGTDNRNITGLGFEPDAMFLRPRHADPTYARTSNMPSDASKKIVQTKSFLFIG